MISFADSANAPLASSVTQLRIDFLAVENGYTGYSEISVQGLGSVQVANGIWTGTTSSDWGTATNWQDNLVPPDGFKETFGNAGARGTVDLGSANRTSGGLTFRANVSTTIGSTQGKLLILDNGASQAAVNVDGTHAVSSAVQLNSDLNINLSVGAQFTMSGTVSENARHNLLATGSGKVVLSGTANTYTGLTIIQDAVLNVASISDYGVPSSVGSRAADTVGTGNATGDVGLLFRGGTLQYTGSTPQVTNRGVRINATGGDGFSGGATFDASGTTPTATLSFTAASSPDFFEQSGNRSLTFTGSNTGENLFALAIVQTGGLTTVNKSGSGRWILNGTSSYSGPTNVTGGTLQASASGSLGLTPTISVTGGGTLLLTGSNFAPSGAAVTLGATGPTAGKLAFSGDSVGGANAGFLQPFASLTLNADSTIDFGAGTGATFSFTALTLNSNALVVDHWSGTAYAPGSTMENGSNTDRLLTNTAFSTADLAKVSFYNDSGVLLSRGAQEISFTGPGSNGTGFEIVPIPEPSTLGAALLAVGLISCRERRRFRRLLASR